MMDEEFIFQPPQLLTADGALATLEAMAGSLRIDVHEQRLQGHLQSILAERQKGMLFCQAIKHADPADEGGSKWGPELPAPCRPGNEPKRGRSNISGA